MGLEQFKIININKCKNNSWSYKKFEENLLIKLKNIIKNNGQCINISVRKIRNEWEIVNGNYVLNILKELNFKEIMVYDYGNLSDEEAKLKSIQINDTYLDIDEFKLAERMNEILKVINVLDVNLLTRFSKKEIDIYNKLFTFKWSDYNKEKLILKNNTFF